MILETGRPTPNDGLGTFHATQPEPWQTHGARFVRLSAQARQTTVRAASEACKNAVRRAEALTQPCKSHVSTATHQRQTPVSGSTQQAEGRHRNHVRMPVR